MGFCYQKNFSNPTLPVDEAQFWALVKASEWNEKIDKYRETHDAALKRKLPAFIFQATFDETTSPKGKTGAWRKQSATQLTGLVVMDIDHVEKPREVFDQWGLGTDEHGFINKDAAGRILLVYITPSGKGLKVVFKADVAVGNLIDNQHAMAKALGVEVDESCKDASRMSFVCKESDILYLNKELFTYENKEFAERYTALYRDGCSQATREDLATTGRAGRDKGQVTDRDRGQGPVTSCDRYQSPVTTQKIYPTQYHGIPFERILKKYWEVNNQGYEPTEGDRDTLTYQLACDLRHICGKNADWLDQVIPCYDGFTPEEKREKIKNALTSEYNGFPLRLKNVLNCLATDKRIDKTDCIDAEEVDLGEQNLLESSSPLLKIPKLPQGVKDSVDAVGAGLAMPVVTAICPCIGTLATGVQLDVHGTKRGLNLISYIAGDFASGKGSIDPVVEAWMSELQALDKMYQQQEDEWRAKKRAAKNKKEQPEEPKLPVRCLTLNNTVANLAERLANTEGKHGFSFTPEADTVAQKWKSTMSDFSVMLRQSYDGSKYEREARSADAVNVHIEHLLWNVCMCGTPDALYRVVNNYTDGFQSRIAVARTPDNTFAPLEDKPNVLTDRQRDRIQQVAHLLPLMYGEVVLPKLEARGREWLEKIRLETMKNDDRTRARQRFRVCVTAQRMTCCLMLCKVCETLIQKHGLTGAEAQLKQKPGLWKELLLKAQTPTMLEAYDVIADQLLENALYFFRDRIENAFQSRDYAGGMNGERTKRGKNDSIFGRLDVQFTFEQAMQHSVAIKGAQVNINTVRQMLKNWRKQGLVTIDENGNYRKVS